MKYLYHGHVLTAIDPALLPLATVIHEADDSAPAAQAPGSQMALMDLPKTAIRRPGTVRGHAMPPGSGPQGETCGTCLHCYVRRSGERAYRKCYLTQSKWTAGAASDVGSADAACSKWEKRMVQS